MKGKIVITCDEHGTHIRSNMTDMAEHDDVFLVHIIGKSLGLEPRDYHVLAMAEAEGVLDGAATPVMVTIDTDELRRQMKEEDQDAC